MRATRIGLLPAILATLLAALGFVLAGCARPGRSLQAAFPAPDSLPGWQPQGQPRRYDRETIFNLVDGQADAYFAYGFEEVAVCSYAGPAGALVDVELWQVATPADAYGLFTAYRAGQPAAAGNAGDTDPGRRLAFWQGRTYVRIRARQDIPQADLERFAAALSQALPQGGERPALVARLPGEGLAEESVLYFHQEISIQDRLWLGGENRLGLNAGTNGVWAEYRLGADQQPVKLLVIEYPDEAAAASGLAALEALGLPDIAAAQAHGRLLAAAFGSMDAAAAAEWLQGIVAAQ
jgi:hypothetical protein